MAELPETITVRVALILSKECYKRFLIRARDENASIDELISRELMKKERVRKKKKK